LHFEIPPMHLPIYRGYHVVWALGRNSPSNSRANE
jgi:hypothetical protein